MPARVAIVGGGIAGLAATLLLHDAGVDTVLIEGSDRLGGKLRTEQFAGGYLEAGAESFLVRDADGAVSAAVKLARRVGLGEAVRHPGVSSAALAIDGRLEPIPGGTLMGIPIDGVEAPDSGRPLLGPGQDIAVGTLVRARFGDAVVDRFVDPLLGGVYAGRADDLSLAAAIPLLAEAARSESTLAAAVRSALAQRTGPGGPVFGAVEGGMSRLVEALLSRLTGTEILLGSPVRELHRCGEGWRLVAGSTRDARPIEADAVVLALPSRPAARLLTGVDQKAAQFIGALDYASVALVGLAVPGAVLPTLSGFLVPADQGYEVKALTILSTKWVHLARADGVALLRASVGRYRENQVLRHDDASLVRLVHKELGQLLGSPLPEPVATAVWRWGGGLPQYAPGHLERVATARSRLPATLALAGAAFDGVGIPACIASGQTAAVSVLGVLSGSRA